MKDKSIVISVPFEQRDKVCNSLIQALLHINTSGLPGDHVEIRFRNIKRDSTVNVQTLIINLN